VFPYSQERDELPIGIDNLNNPNCDSNMSPVVIQPSEQCTIRFRAPLQRTQLFPKRSEDEVSTWCSLDEKSPAAANPNSVASRKRKWSFAVDGKRGEFLEKELHHSHRKKYKKGKCVLLNGPEKKKSPALRRKHRNEEPSIEANEEHTRDSEIRVKLERRSFDVFVNPNFNDSFNCNR